MIAISNTSIGEMPISNSLRTARSYQIDWLDARCEYAHSVIELLAAIRRCSELALSDEEKRHLLEVAREREQAAFVRYKRALDAQSHSQ